MSFVARAACDVCQRVKGEANHWYGYSKTVLLAGRLSLYPWNEQDAQFDGSICSDDCAHKLLSRYLSGEASPSNEQKGEPNG